MEWAENRTLRQLIEDESTYSVQIIDETSSNYQIVLGPGRNHQGPLCAVPGPEQLQRCLHVPPEIQEKLRSLVATIVQSGGDPRQRVEAIEQYLMVNFSYTLDIPRSNGDPLLEFLFNRKSGHCQYFASAMVLMAQSAGVPARMVTGFYAHERTGKDTMVVRQRDAHAWAECWIDGVGWVTVDATPDAGRPDQLASSVGYLRKFQEWLQDVWTAIKQWLMTLGWFRIAIGAIVASALLGIAKWVYDLIRRRKPRRRGLEMIYGEGELASLAMAFDRLLRRLNLSCAAHQTWSEHLDRLQPPARLDVQLARQFVQCYQTARFGDAPRNIVLGQLGQILGRLDDRNDSH